MDAHLGDGLVIGTIVECPLHQGTFDMASGKALIAPVCEGLRTYPVKDGTVCVRIRLLRGRA